MPTGAKAFFAACFLISAVAAGLSSLPLLLGGVEATGTIIGLVDNDCRGDPFAPVVTFKDEHDVEQTFTAESCSQGYRVGESVAVRFFPGRAETVDLATSLYLVGGLSIGCLLVATGFGFFVGRDLVRRRKPAG